MTEPPLDPPTNFPPRPTTLQPNAPQRIAIAVVRSGDHVLVGQRPPGVPLAGYWEFPGGKVHVGESLAAATQRECQEETGLAVRVGAPLLVQPYDYTHAQVLLHFMDCELTCSSPSEQSPCPRPFDPFRWISRGELDTHMFPPANRGILDLLRQGR